MKETKPVETFNSKAYLALTKLKHLRRKRKDKLDHNTKENGARHSRPGNYVTTYGKIISRDTRIL